MGVGAGLYMYVVVVQKFTFAISSPDEFLLVRDETETKTFLQFHETETSDFCRETRPRPCKAETETFFETFNLQHCAKTMNGDLPLLMSQTAQLLQLQMQCSLS